MKILQVCPGYFPSIGGVGQHVRKTPRLADSFTKGLFWPTNLLARKMVWVVMPLKNRFEEPTMQTLIPYLPAPAPA